MDQRTESGAGYRSWRQIGPKLDKIAPTLLAELGNVVTAYDNGQMDQLPTDACFVRFDENHQLVVDSIATAIGGQQQASPNNRARSGSH